MVVLFDVYLPALMGTMLLFLAGEQLYIFRFITSGYKIVNDRLVLMISISFLVFSIGSIVSASLNYLAFWIVNENPLNMIGYQAVRSSLTLLSIFEVIGFIFLLYFPIVSSRRSYGVYSIIPLWLVSIYDYRIMVYIILIALIMSVIALVLRNVRKIFSLEVNTILLGLIFLAFSKAILILPSEANVMSIFSVFIEVLSFSTFIVLRDIVSLTARGRSQIGMLDK